MTPPPPLSVPPRPAPAVFDLGDVATAYDAVAQDYALAFADELEGKPRDRELLNDFARRVRPGATVADIGCGPGQVARHLADQGIDVVGVDLSAAMVAEASRRHPDVAFFQGNVLALEVEDGAWGGAVAFYSLMHMPRGQVPAALSELHRALAAGSPLLLAMHGGRGDIHAEEWFGRPLRLDAALYELEEMVALLLGSGFRVETREERPPYPQELRTPRLFALALRTEQS